MWNHRRSFITIITNKLKARWIAFLEIYYEKETKRIFLPTNILRRDKFRIRWISNLPSLARRWTSLYMLETWQEIDRTTKDSNRDINKKSRSAIPRSRGRSLFPLHYMEPRARSSLVLREQLRELLPSKSGWATREIARCHRAGLTT